MYLGISQTMSHFGSYLFLTTSPILLLSAYLSIFSNPKEPSNGKQVIPIVGAVGPESLAFDPHGGGPYTGVSDGRIIKWMENERRWIDFAVTSPQRYSPRCYLYLVLITNVLIARWPDYSN